MLPLADYKRIFDLMFFKSWVFFLIVFGFSGCFTGGKFGTEEALGSSFSISSYFFFSSTLGFYSYFVSSISSIPRIFLVY